MTTTKTWTDEAGLEIPVSRISKTEKDRNASANRLLKAAQKAHAVLTDLKEMVRAECEKAYQDALVEYAISNPEGKQRKGNFTFFSFDRRIKIETSINERITFDDLKIAMCKEKLDEFIGSSLSNTDSFIKELVMDAFATSRGQLDANKVMSLLKHKSKIKDQRFHDAMDILEESIRRPDSKKYFRVWLKDEHNEYKNIDLNFSSI